MEGFKEREPTKTPEVGKMKSVKEFGNIRKLGNCPVGIVLSYQQEDITLRGRKAGVGKVDQERRYQGQPGEGGRGRVLLIILRKK